MAAISRAFSVGRAESQAVSALQVKVHPAILSLLTEAVSRRGMRYFLTRDIIARGAFNQAFTSAQGSTEAWMSFLTNSDDLKLVTWTQWH